MIDGFVQDGVNSESFDLPVPKLGEEFKIGITACEGVNRFYEATIEEK